jgi:hypothetical protein
MESLHEIAATGKDGVLRMFRYKCRTVEKLYDLQDLTSRRRHWEIEVWRIEESTDVDAGFRATAVEVDDQVAISTEMFADRDEFRTRGLPEALLRELALRSDRTIFSSSNTESAHLLKSEIRTPDSEKVWRRVFAAGNAAYDPTTDRYRLTSI